MSTTRSGLRVRGLNAGYGTTKVLHGLSIAAPAGEVLAVLGPNGAGKTTLLRSIFGVTSVVSGEIEFDGESLTGLPSHHVARKGLCYITEGRAIYRSMTVEENLRLFSNGTPGARDRVFDTFPVLAERRAQVAGTMSGGQQQMLALSRCLTRQYKALLVDELSMGLAPVIIDELFDLLERLRAQGLTMVIVEQYAERALGIADLAVVLNKGRVVFNGEADELNTSSDLAALYLGSGSTAGTSSSNGSASATPAPEPAIVRRRRPLRATATGRDPSPPNNGSTLRKQKRRTP